MESIDFLAAGSCQFDCLIFTVLALLFASVAAPAMAAQQSMITDEVYHVCNPNNYSSNNSFVRNFNKVATSLTHNSSQFLYSLASSETGADQLDYVYGMYQCRGDISLSDCSSCVINGLSQLSNTNTSVSLCKMLAGGARVRYTGCYLRYENFIFYQENIAEDYTKDYERPPLCTDGSSTGTSALYQQNLDTALQNSVAAAPKHALFGYNASNVGSGSNTAYALAQCLGYLSPSECAACLSELVSNSSNVCNKSVSGEVYLYTCFYLFSNTDFLFTYNDSRPPALQASGTNIGIGSPLPEKSKSHTPTIVGIVGGVCLLLAIVITLSLYFLKRRRNSADIYKSLDLLVHGDKQLLTGQHGARRFAFQELQVATENFHAKNELGKGGFGPVYQGKLVSGMEVAIKMLSAQSRQGKAEFLNEVNLISTVRHRNLIELIGCCVEGSKPLLVYEYLPKRSLNLHLFDVDAKDALDWHTRFNIIMGIARGLRYLHEDSPVRIVHRDIKATNILLDNNLKPKIADFGLARLFEYDMTHVTTRVAGTMGYLSPEYARSGKLTEKADIYSFGMVALEIVSGRRVADNEFDGDEDNLLDWAWASYEREQPLQIVDKRMQRTPNTSSGTDDVSMKVNVQEVIRVVHVALLCTQLHPQARPSMSEVYSMLCGQLEILNLPSRACRPSVELKDSQNADPTSELEPR